MTVEKRRSRPGTKPIFADLAVKQLRAAGFEPAEEYPGRSDRSWKVKCATCDRPCRITLSHVRQGRRCAHQWVSPERAAAEVREAGLIPQGDYPGTPRAHWPMVCSRCDQPCRGSLYRLRAYGPCQCRRLPDDVAAERAEKELRAAGYEPRAPYPGFARSPWPAICVTCKRKCKPSLSTIRQGKTCSHGQWKKYPAATPEQAMREFLAAGYEPITPYPGAMQKPWLSLCKKCRQPRKPSLRNVRQGSTCTHTYKNVVQ
ncbi:hypothetical protein DC74_2961 [Streptomyces noursei]|nr:hypothetical protein DC74_2961 [Streptomyces noursei]